MTLVRPVRRTPRAAQELPQRKKKEDSASRSCEIDKNLLHDGRKFVARKSKRQEIENI